MARELKLGSLPVHWSPGTDGLKEALGLHFANRSDLIIPRKNKKRPARCGFAHITPFVDCSLQLPVKHCAVGCARLGMLCALLPGCRMNQELVGCAWPGSSWQWWAWAAGKRGTSLWIANGQ